MNPLYGNWSTVGDDIPGADLGTFASAMAVLDRRWMASWREARCLARSHPGRPVLHGELRALVEARRAERWTREENERRSVAPFASAWTHHDNTSGWRRREWVPERNGIPGHWRVYGSFAWVNGTWTRGRNWTNEVTGPWSAEVDDRFRRRFPPWVDLRREGFDVRGEAMAWADGLLRRAGVYFEPEMGS